jgi:hypothetical protein
VAIMATQWGSPNLTRITSPSLSEDPENMGLRAMATRASAPPRSAAAQFDYILRSLDVRHALALIQAPTLVLHVTENPFVPVTHGRYIADNAAGANFIELPGRDVGCTPFLVSDEVSGLSSRWNASSPRCSSLTSSAPPPRPHHLATSAGARSLTATTRRCASNSGAFVE